MAIRQVPATYPSISSALSASSDGDIIELTADVTESVYHTNNFGFTIRSEGTNLYKWDYSGSQSNLQIVNNFGASSPIKRITISNIHMRHTSGTGTVIYDSSSNQYSEVHLQDSIFERTSGTSGPSSAVIEIINSLTGNPGYQITRCEIFGGGNGTTRSGILLSATTTERCIIIHNTLIHGVDYGTGAALEVVQVTTNPVCEMFNCTIMNCNAGILSRSTNDIRNCVFSGTSPNDSRVYPNTNLILSASTTDFTYCAFRQSVSDGSPSPAWDSTNRFSIDNSIEFVDYAGGNFAVDTGTSVDLEDNGEYLSAYLTDDINKTSRPVGPAYDIGAYEAESSGGGCNSPSISSLVPPSGELSTVTNVIIHGSYFDPVLGNNIVEIDGSSVGIIINSVNGTGTELDVDFPSTLTLGSKSVNVTTTCAISNSSTFVVKNLPTVSSVTPSCGISGTSVTITGTNFDETIEGTSGDITVGGTSLSNITYVNSTTATGNIPSLAYGDRDIIVSTDIGSSNSNIAFDVSPDTSSISNISPDNGAPAAVVTISGLNFLGNESLTLVDTVTFNGGLNLITVSGDTAPVDGTVIRFNGGTLPTGLTANTRYVITNSATPSADDFQILDKSGGTLVTFTGNGSGTINMYRPVTQAVWFGSNRFTTSEVSVASNTVINMTVPDLAPADFDVRVETLACSPYSNTFANFTVNPPAPITPEILSLTPTSGVIGSNQAVTITGLNFGSSQGTGSVNFVGQTYPLVISAWSATEISGTVEIATSIGAGDGIDVGTYLLAVTTDLGDISPTYGGFTVNASGPTISSLDSTAGCEGKTLEITGTNFVDPVSVDFVENGSSHSIPIDSYNSTTINVTIPSLDPDAYDVKVTTNGGDVTFSEYRGYEDAPSSVIAVPTTVQIGDNMTVAGSNFLNLITTEASVNATSDVNLLTDIITLASPDVPLAQGTAVVPVGSGAPSVGLVENKVYYVYSPAGATLKLSTNPANLAGSVVNLSGSPSGTFNMYYVPDVEFRNFSDVNMTEATATVQTASSSSLSTIVPTIVTDEQYQIVVSAKCDDSSPFQFVTVIPPDPTVTSVTPAIGKICTPATTTVTVGGTDFINVTSVKFVSQVDSDEFPTTYNTIGTTQMSVDLPYGLPLETFDIVVTTTSGTTVINSPASSFELQTGVPVLDSLGTSSGVKGATITLSGNFFTETNFKLYMVLNEPVDGPEDIHELVVANVTQSSLDFTVPVDLDLGTYKFYATSNCGNSGVSSFAFEIIGFTILDITATPNTGDVTSQTTITTTSGSILDTYTSVTLDGETCNVVSYTADEIVISIPFKSPATYTNGLVVTLDGGSSASTTYTVTDTLGPIINFSPVDRVFNPNTTQVISVTDIHGVSASNITVTSAPAGTVISGPVQITSTHVDMALTISASGSVTIDATDDNGNPSSRTENGYILDTNVPVITRTDSNPNSTSATTIHTTFDVTDDIQINTSGIIIVPEGGKVIGQIASITQVNSKKLELAIDIIRSGILTLVARDVAGNQAVYVNVFQVAEKGSAASGEEYKENQISNPKFVRGIRNWKKSADGKFTIDKDIGSNGNQLNIEN